jgi:Flp pilus assembly protein TadD
MNRGVEARELYIKLAKMRPADTAVWSEAGTLAWDLDDYRRLAVCSTQMIALAPERYEGYLFRGINERHNGNNAQAIDLFRKAAERAPDCALPHLLLGQVLEQTGDTTGAKLAYHQALHVEPSSSDAQELLRRMGESDGRVTVVPTD